MCIKRRRSRWNFFTALSLSPPPSFAFHTSVSVPLHLECASFCLCLRQSTRHRHISLNIRRRRSLSSSPTLVHGIEILLPVQAHSHNTPASIAQATLISPSVAAGLPFEPKHFLRLSHCLPSYASEADAGWARTGTWFSESSILCIMKIVVRAPQRLNPVACVCRSCAPHSFVLSGFPSTLD
ncbi:hypothetical protein BC835DRAFT_95806 [Cytidiella melzeri]|nr:hypothetical protein BC835DRAFT_95806 [Cytidiella melzeri]